MFLWNFDQKQRVVQFQRIAIQSASWGKSFEHFAVKEFQLYKWDIEIMDEIKSAKCFLMVVVWERWWHFSHQLVFLHQLVHHPIITTSLLAVLLSHHQCIQSWHRESFPSHHFLSSIASALAQYTLNNVTPVCTVRQHTNSHILQYQKKPTTLRDWWRFERDEFSEKFQRGEGGSFQKFMLQILEL